MSDEPDLPLPKEITGSCRSGKHEEWHTSGHCQELLKVREDSTVWSLCEKCTNNISYQRKSKDYTISDKQIRKRATTDESRSKDGRRVPRTERARRAALISSGDAGDSPLSQTFQSLMESASDRKKRLNRATAKRYRARRRAAQAGTASQPQMTSDSTIGTPNSPGSDVSGYFDEAIAFLPGAGTPESPSPSGQDGSLYDTASSNKTPWNAETTNSSILGNIDENDDTSWINEFLELRN